MAKYPAAFINAIAEEGTKEDAIKYLQKMYDNFTDEIKALKAALEKAETERDAALPWQTLTKDADLARERLLAALVASRKQLASSEAARERLHGLLSDCVAIMRGDLVGSFQIDGVLREASAALAAAPAKTEKSSSDELRAALVNSFHIADEEGGDILTILKNRFGFTVVKGE